MSVRGGPTFASVLRGSSPRLYIDPRNPLSNGGSAQINGFSTLNAANLNLTFEGGCGYAVNAVNNVIGDLELKSGRIYNISNTGWYGNMTMCWWMKYIGAISNAYFYMEANRGPSGCSRIYSLINANGTFTFQVWDNSNYSATGVGNITTTSTTNVCDGKWYYICCRWQNSSPAGMYIFVNGVQEGYTACVGNDGAYESLMLGGSYGCAGTVTHNCYLGPIHSFNSALSTTEIVYNYNVFKYRYR